MSLMQVRKMRKYTTWGITGYQVNQKLPSYNCAKNHTKRLVYRAQQLHTNLSEFIPNDQ